MKWTHASAIALLSLVIIAGGASAQQVINSPGHYDVTVIAVPDFEWPGVPPLGPNAYPGELDIRETGNGWTVMFQGQSDSGDQLKIQAQFDRGWSGLTVGPFMVGGQPITNAVIGIDVDDLARAHVNGVGLVDGTVQRLNAVVGEDGSLDQLQTH